MKRARVVARRVGLVLLGLVAGVLALVAVALGVLRTQWGGNLVRNLTVPRVNLAIAGRLEVGGFRYRGDSVELASVVLRDPEGKVVLRARRAALAFSPSALLSNRVQINEITVEAPELALERGPRGLNLARAIAPRRAPVPEPEPVTDEVTGEPSKLVIVIQRLALRGGVVRFKDLEPGGLPPIHLEAIESSGDARLALATSELRVNLAVDGRTAAPVRAPLALRVHAEIESADDQGEGQTQAPGAGPGPGQATVRFDWAGSRIDLAGRRRDATHAEVTIKEIRVAPALVRSFVPSYPVLPDVVLTGQAQLRGRELAADLALAAATTRARLTAEADIQTQRARAVKLDVQRIDLAALMKSGPRSRFDLVVTGKGEGRSAETAVGEARLEIPAGGRLSGTPFGPVRVAVAADRGRFTLAELLAALPGLRVTGQGKGDQDQVALDAQVTARDLGLTARSLGLPAGRRAQGRGNLTVTLRGPRRAPALDARGHLPLLRLDDTEVNELRLAAHADALGRPSRARAQLRAKSVRLGARKLGAVSADLSSSDLGVFTASLALAGPLPLELRAAGKLAENGKEIRLDRLGVGYPRATWALARPARIVFAEGVIIDGLDLRATAGQRIAADLNLRQPSQRLEAQLTIAALDLSRLPALIAPEGKRLEGKLDLEAQSRGRLPRPDVDLKLALTGGRYDGFADLAVKMEARHRRGRATGQLTARALGAEHRAAFDLPALFPPAASAPVMLQLEVGEIDLPRALTMLAHPLQGKVRGRAGLSVTVSGRAGDPGLTLDAQTRGLQVEREALGDIVVRLRDPAGAPLVLEVSSKLYGQASELRLETPVVMGTWLRRPPRERELLATPFHLRAQVGRFPLAAFTARPGKAAPSMGGTIALAADLQGPVKRLTGTLSADAQAVSAPSFPATDGNLRLRLGEGARGVDMKLRLGRKGQVIGHIEARVEAPIRQLLDETALGRAPLALNARLGPIVLQRVGPPAQIKKDSPRILRARVDAQLALKGTLDAPILDARLRAADGRLGRTPLGSADISITYAAARPVVKANLASANGGRLLLDGSARADLSLPALRKGLPTRDLPVQASLSAEKFDLTFLSGLSDAVRAVAGQLDAQATLAGTVGTPQLAGRVAWREGRLMMAGFGELRDVDLAFRGDQKEMVLERLFARSGSGEATVTARAVRQPDGRRLAIDARARLSQFRMYTEGQPVGALSLKATASGEVAPERIIIDSSISEAHFQLAEGDRKKLQPLKRPRDVVLVAHGKPLDRGEARRLAELTEMQRALMAGAAQEEAAAAASKKVAAAAKKPASGDERLLRVTVEAPRNLWIRGDDANIELGLDPNFALVSTDQPRVFGTVKVRRGQVNVFGRRFDVTADSSVTFTGPPDTPRLSVDAVHRVDRGGEPTTVQVHIAGPADRLTFNLRSPEHPDWGDSELVTFIITGRPPGDEAGTFAAGDKAASLVGSLVANKLQKALATRLPLDVLTIEPGQDLQATKLEAGTYLGDDLYVAYVGRLGGDDPFKRENRNELHLEYQLTRRWSFEGTYGDQRRGSADLIWTKNY